MQASDTTRLQRFQRSQRLMGNRFAFTVVTDDEAFADDCLNKAVAEISRIEALLTTFNEESQTAAINREAGLRPVKVDEEVFALIARSLKISTLTQGAFDITYGSLDKRLWNFDATLSALPGKESLKKAVRLINYRNVVLDAEKQTVFLKEKGMRIGFGGIGKGYAADRAKAVLQNLGIESGVVNASGDLAAWGTQPDGKPWTVGIADPSAKTNAFSSLVLNNGAIATSGAYEKFAVIGGKRYSHTIDPKTGLPVQGIESVTVLAPSAELADALATPVMVMGVRAGLALMNQLKHTACIVLDEAGRLHTTNNISIKHA